MSLNNEEIVSLLRGYEKDSKAYKETTLRVCWYMRGSISYDDAMLLSDADMKLIKKIVDENMKITKESGLPYF